LRILRVLLLTGRFCGRPVRLGSRSRHVRTARLTALFELAVDGPQILIAGVDSLRNSGVYLTGGGSLNRRHNTRQRDYRQADTDVGADVIATAGHVGPAVLLNGSHLHLLKAASRECICALIPGAKEAFMDTRLTPLEKTEMKINIAVEIRRLAERTVPELRVRHEELFGEAARSTHKQYLTRQMAWRLQAEAEGGLPEETRQMALAIARDAPLRLRIESAALRGTQEVERTATTRLASTHDSRLPMPGSLLMKEHKGETHVVKVLDGGFEYQGRVYRSLSAIAQQITGTKWNGYAFFSLTKEAPHGRR
jgi:hypothetical protein